MIRIVTASEHDIPIIEDILLDAVRWLDSVSQPLWNAEQITWQRLARDFRPNDFLIAFLDGIPAACMALVDHDPLIWPEIEKGQALFLHKLAVKRFAAGKGLSAALIAHAKSMCMDREISALRLDCHTYRPKLRAVYERNGFVCVAEKILFEKYHTAYYECEVRDTRHLYHYYENSLPPLRSITSLPFEKAVELLRSHQAEDPNRTHPNIEWFLTRRYEMEKKVRDRFIDIGGKPINDAPVYCTLGANEGMKTWFREGAHLRIPISSIDLDAVSFTYGDTFPVFNPALNTGEEWWGQVYRYDGILRLIDQYGFPEDPVYDSIHGIFPKDKPINQYLKYIEAHVWSDEVLNPYR